jgi:hypothetical protein
MEEPFSAFSAAGDRSQIDPIGADIDRIGKVDYPF